MTFILGLTGSIGMGKSTTAAMFVDEGCALWDADKAVHALYTEGGAAVAPMRTEFPQAIENDTVSRTVLKGIIGTDPTALARIEAIVHPLVAEDRRQFLQETSADIAVLDIPLLFETGDPEAFDGVACVIVAEEIQRARIMERGSMTSDQLDVILAKQMPAEEKARRSDFVIETDTLDHARQQVQDIILRIRGGWTRHA